MNTNRKKAINKIKKLLGLSIFTVTITAAVPVFAQEISAASSLNPQELLRNALEWIDSLGALGSLAFIAIYTAATVAFLPGSILTLGAGVVFGVIQGSIYVFVGATVRASLVFLVGRYLARSSVSKRIAGNQKFSTIDKAVGREGFKIVFLTRRFPVFPFNVLNYGLGVTGVSFRDYLLGCVGIIPGTIMYIYIGSLAGNLAMIGSEDQPTDLTVQWAIRIIGFIATVAVTLYVTGVAKKALNEAIPDT